MLLLLLLLLTVIGVVIIISPLCQPPHPTPNYHRLVLPLLSSIGCLHSVYPISHARIPQLASASSSATWTRRAAGLSRRPSAHRAALYGRSKRRSSVQRRCDVRRLKIDKPTQSSAIRNDINSQTTHDGRTGGMSHMSAGREWEGPVGGRIEVRSNSNVAKRHHVYERQH